MRGGALGRRTLAERLERKIVYAKASHLVLDECWLWQGARSTATKRKRGGYPLIKIGGSAANPTAVHRLMWERANGPIPEGLVPDHLCEVRNCVNPAHMELVTSGENVRRAFARRRVEAGRAA